MDVLPRHVTGCNRVCVEIHGCISTLEYITLLDTHKIPSLISPPVSIIMDITDAIQSIFDYV